MAGPVFVPQSSDEWEGLQGQAPVLKSQTPKLDTTQDEWAGLGSQQQQPIAQPEKPTNPPYQLYADLWEQTQGTAERLQAQHDLGWKEILDDIKNGGVAFGVLPQEDFELGPIDDNTLRNSPSTAERYLPWVTEAMEPLVRFAPFVEAGVGASFAGQAIGAVAGAATGPAAAVAAPLGTLLGGVGLPFNTFALMGAGRTYRDLRGKGYSHEDARAAAPYGAIADGIASVVGIKGFQGATNAAFRKMAKATFTPQLMNPILLKIAGLGGFGTTVNIADTAAHNFAEMVAHAYDNKVPMNINWSKSLADAGAAGFWTSVGLAAAAKGGGTAAGGLLRGAKYLQDAVIKFVYARAGISPPSGPTKAPALSQTPFQMMFSQSAAATSREQRGLPALIVQLNDARQRLAAATTDVERRQAQRDVDWAEYEVEVFQHEQALRDPGTAGDPFWAALQGWADALAKLIGKTVPESPDPSGRVNVGVIMEEFKEGTKKFFRNFPNSMPGWDLAWEFLFQKDPNAARIAAELSPFAATNRQEATLKILIALWEEVASEAFGKSVPETKKLISKIGNMRFRITHRQLGNTDHTGARRTAGTKVWTGNGRELVTLYGQFFHDKHYTENGHRVGNGYDLDINNPESLASKVKFEVERNPLLKAAVSAVLKFGQKRAPFVQALEFRKEGQSTPVPPGYFGSIKREDVHEFELFDPNQRQSAANGGYTSVGIRTPASTFSRTPESKKPIKNSDFMDSIIGSNHALSALAGYLHFGPMAYQVARKGEVIAAAERQFNEGGGQYFIQNMQQHQKDITQGVVKAKAWYAKAFQATMDSAYSIFLGLSAAQFPKQLVGSISAYGLLKNKQAVAAGIASYSQRTEQWDQFLSKNVKGRYTNFRATSLGQPSSITSQSKGAWDKTLDYAVSQGDQGSVALVGPAAYIDGLMQGMNKAQAIEYMNKIINHSLSPSRTENLPPLSRTLIGKLFPFTAQMQLMGASVSRLMQDVGNFGKGQEGAKNMAKAWSNYAAGIGLVITGEMLYKGAGDAVRILTDPDIDDDKKHEIFQEELATGIDAAVNIKYPVLNEIGHRIFLSGIQLAMDGEIPKDSPAPRFLPADLWTHTADLTKESILMAVGQGDDVDSAKMAQDFVLGLPNFLKLPDVGPVPLSKVTGLRIPYAPAKYIIDQVLDEDGEE